ncbi:MAG: hypothetical protein KDD83_22140, partial [Caldilineaceae bacterium]|nr:hypothetical protein [Caldilineaceae bacterium]
AAHGSPVLHPEISAESVNPALSISSTDERSSESIALAATSWITTVVDSVGVGGAIDVDPADQVRISYYAATGAQSGVVRVAQRAGDSWQFEDVPQSGETPSLGAVTSLAIDAQGHDHVASIWYNWFTQQTYYATNAGDVGWTTPTMLDSFYASPVSIAVATGTDEFARVTYCTQNEQTLAIELWYIEMRADGTIGFRTRVSDEGCWLATSLAVNAANEPQIAYHSQENGVHTGILKYAARVEGEWQIETVDDTGNAGFDLSLALESDGTPHISYLYRAPENENDGVQLEVRYATRTGGAWHIATVATIPEGQESIGGTSIALDALGQPQIVYFDQDAGAIVYSWYAEGQWQRGHIIEVEYVQLITARALVLDGSGVAHLTYDTTNGQIYATGELPEPTVLDLVGFSIVHEGQDNVIRWRTGVELSTFGFHLWRSATPLRAEAVRVTPHMIMATGSDSSYLYVDTAVTANEETTYWLQEVETSGHTVEYGPYVVNSAQSGSARLQQKLYLPIISNR